MAELPVALSIAALDPSGGAGLGSDLRTFASEGVWGCAVATAVTYQSGSEMSGWYQLEPATVLRQIEVLISDVAVPVVKVGMVGSADVARAIGDALYGSGGLPRPGSLLVDPVLATSRGESLASAGTLDALVESLFPFASLLLPNLDEAGAILGRRPASVAEMADAAREIAKLGPAAVLLTGGHLDGSGDSDEVSDVLWADGRVEVFTAPRIYSGSTHGTGCVLSASISAGIAKGRDLRAAILGARERVRAGLEAGVRIGAGRGPVDPMVMA